MDEQIQGADQSIKATRLLVLVIVVLSDHFVLVLVDDVIVSEHQLILVPVNDPLGNDLLLLLETVGDEVVQPSQVE